MWELQPAVKSGGGEAGRRRARRGLRRRIGRLAMAVLLSSAGAAGPALALEAIEVTGRAVPLDYADPEATGLGLLDYRGGLSLTSSNPHFGGLSGLLVAADCSTFRAVSDGGWLVGGRLIFDAEDRLTGVAETTITALRNTDGEPLRRRFDFDAEALVRDGAGGMIVAFEHRHRLWRYADPDALPEPLEPPPAILTLPLNDGIETLTELADGRLLAFAEGGAGAEKTRGWVGRPGAWSELTLALQGDFRPTGATTLPGGDILLLQRRFPPVGVKILRISAGVVRPGAEIDGEELIRLEGAHPVDNFEGIDVCGRGDGRTLVLIVSDDNFSVLQRTLLLAFALPSH